MILGKKSVFSRRFFSSVVTTAVILSLCIFSFGIESPAQALIQRPSTAPKIVNWNYAWSIDSADDVHTLAQWDVIIFDIENAYYSRERMQRIKEENPDIIFLAYISLVDIRPDAHELDNGTARRDIGEALEANPDWLLYKANGNQAEWWPTYNIMNITDEGQNTEGELFRDYFVNYIRDRVIEDDLWDGIFYDNLWESISFVSSSIDLDRDGIAESQTEMDAAWQNGVRKAIRKTRRTADNAGRSSFIITGNGGTEYTDYLNGVGFEHFPDTVYGGWSHSMEEYFFVMRHASRDPFGLINTNVQNTNDQYNYQRFRFGLTSTLLHDGYYSFDSGDQTHHQRWYYDEYSIMLGNPVTGAFNIRDPEHPTRIQDGVWRRDFEEATVLVNSTNTAQFVELESAYEKIQGTQDTAVNSGELIGSVTIPAHDGIILLNRLDRISRVTSINGAFAKVFDLNGEEERNSFFPYDGTFAPGSEVHTLPRYTIVADQTYVRVYDKTNQLVAAFAPYGTGYTGGVHIAVDKLYRRKNVIVTGTASAPAQVKIFSLRGVEKRYSGCFPFGRQFTGGVNVAIGNMNDDRKKEIVVGAGAGGGPQVLILNNQCSVINTGFFAYDRSFRTGVNVAVGDVNGDSRDDIITAPGVGGGPQVKVFSRRGRLLSSAFFAYDTSDRSGVWVAAADIDDDGVDEIITNSFSVFNDF